MKSLKLITICCLMLFCGTMAAQQKSTKGWIIIESIKKDPTLGKSFKEKAINLSSLDTLWRTDKKLGNFEIQDLMNTLNSFENAVLKGDGKKIIMPKHVSAARSKFPGKDINAFKGRFKMHLTQMERAFDEDE